MSNEAIIAVGLLADAIGALGIVVPDLPSRYRSKIQRWTPVLRKYIETEDQLTNYASDLPEPDVMYQRVRRVEPAFHNYSKAHRLENFDTDLTETVEWETNAILNLRDREGELVEEVHINQVRGAIQEYIEKTYRTWGWLLLASGFIVQLIGTLL